MLNIDNLITKIRNIIADNTSLALTDVFTPDLPQDNDNICCVTLLGGITDDNLCNEMNYATITFRVLVRGTQNDTTTRSLTNEIFNSLHLNENVSFTGGKIINIIAVNTPIYAFRDENQRLHYDMTFRTIVQ